MELTPSAALTDPTVTGSGRLPGRTQAVPYPDLDGARGAASSPWWASLDGQWRFELLDGPHALSAEMVDASTDDSDWATIEVPGAWTLQPAGSTDRPHYTNVIMPFDLEPPAVPEHNPTGVYRRTVTVPRAWKGRRVVLRVGAAESLLQVWVDGHSVGAGTDSRLPNEFDITDHVRAGRRATIVLVVSKWCAATWLEDQDQWWHGGIQRSVSWYSTEPSHLEDVQLLPGLVDASTGTLDIEVTAAGPLRREPGWQTEVRVETLRGRQLASTGRLDLPAWDASSEAAQLISGTFTRPGVVRTRLRVDDISPWSHEKPHRYRVLTVLTDPDGRVVEVLAHHTGFRSLEIRDNELLINGVPVLIHGVNLHEHDPATGRSPSEALTRSDLLLMKAHHLNAVRAAHYPHDEHLAELCDELGLYLVDEANVESHARQTSLVHDPRFGAAIVERVERMVRRDQHHPSIVMWSLGNESGDGAAHAAAAAWVRHHDPTRPLHYEGPVMHDLYADAPVTDVVCPMYSSIDDIVAWATSGRDTRRPLILCEYSHAMGNSNGSLSDYWAAFESTHGLQGGFIWEWLEHGLRLPGTGPGGRPVWGYGGDFGDTPNDANFVCDGLVSADRVPHPAMEEVRFVGRPVSVRWLDDRRRRLVVTNRRWFTGIDDLVATWRLLVDGAEVATGSLDVPAIDPRASVEVGSPIARRRIPEGGEAQLEVVWRTRRATPWARSGTEVAAEQLEVAVAASDDPTPEIGTDPLGLVPADDLLDAASLTPTIFRALTDNDGIRIGWMRGLVGQLGRWVDQQGLDRCEWAEGPTRRRRRGDDLVAVSTGELVAPGVTEPVRVTRRVTTTPSGWAHLEVEFVVPEQLADPPRIGVEWRLPGDLEQLEWFGDGPHESYPDRRAAARVGRWSTTVDDTYVDYVLPQEHGHRGGLRWLSLTPSSRRGRRSTALLVVADERSDASIGFAARHLSDAQLWAARHTSDLEPSDTVTYLYLDAAQRGLGTGSCGPDALERYRIPAGRHRLGVWVTGFDPAVVSAAELAASRRRRGT